MEPSKIRLTNTPKKLLIKSYTGLYPPGGFVSRPNVSLTTDAKSDKSYRRSKAGGFIALPTVK